MLSQQPVVGLLFINQNAGGALGVEVVNTSDTRIRFRMRNCFILDYYRK